MMDSLHTRIDFTPDSTSGLAGYSERTLIVELGSSSTFTAFIGDDGGSHDDWFGACEYLESSLEANDGHLFNWEVSLDTQTGQVLVYSPHTLWKPLFREVDNEASRYQLAWSLLGFDPTKDYSLSTWHRADRVPYGSFWFSGPNHYPQPSIIRHTQTAVGARNSQRTLVWDRYRSVSLLRDLLSPEAQEDMERFYAQACDGRPLLWYTGDSLRYACALDARYADGLGERLTKGNVDDYGVINLQLIVTT